MLAQLALTSQDRLYGVLATILLLLEGIRGGGGYRYLLACAYSFPLLGLDKGAELGASGNEARETSGTGLPEDVREYEPSEVPEIQKRVGNEDELADLKEFAEGHGELWEELPYPEGGVDLTTLPGLNKVTRRMRSKRPEDPDDVLPETPVRTHTLLLGTPLRSKKGREVLGQVQHLINKLESYGFPVHRFHSDRAQELKSASLVSWLRDKGVLYNLDARAGACGQQGRGRCSAY